jgi:hypothetical protein
VTAGDGIPPVAVLSEFMAQVDTLCKANGWPSYSSALSIRIRFDVHLTTHAEVEAGTGLWFGCFTIRKFFYFINMMFVTTSSIKISLEQ